MTSAPASSKQQEIIAEFGIPPEFDAAHELERRVAFLADYLRATGLQGYVLGISGGVDSSVAGRLTQLAVERVRESGQEATFVAMRLPYGEQKDEADAKRALEFIRPDEVLTVNIEAATDEMFAEVDQAGVDFTGITDADFVKGNVKARQRMIAQYFVAGARGMLVLGTDHAAEAVVGFYTKFGDGACDLTPLAGLNKRRVRALGTELGASVEITDKVPTADLEDHKPQLPDEVALGVSYADIDDYLEGKDVSAEARRTIEDWHRRTAHKRRMPIGPDDV